MKSQPRSIPVAQPVLTENAKIYVNDCLDSTWISSTGKYIGQFESMFADACGVSHAIACNNGTTALHLALVGLGIGPGDEVIVPNVTYIASANCVKYCGATPVFVDCNTTDYNIDPTKIEASITAKTKAIMPVHLYGHPCDMDAILAIAQRHNLLVIEDAAEAHGAVYKGKKVGSFGQCATFSFFGNKIVTTGEGGAIVTNDAALAQKLRLFRGQGMDPARRYWFEVIGYNYRITNIAAAIGVSQMERLDLAIENRRKLANKYNHALASLQHVIGLPSVADGVSHVFWMYTINLLPSSPVSRDQLMERLAASGIETRPVFYPMHMMPPYAEDGANYPNSSKYALSGINLPTHEHLTDDDIHYIAAKLGEELSKN